MPRSARWRSAIAVAATFVLVSVSYEIRTLIPKVSGMPQWALWLLSFVLANGGTVLLWAATVRIRAMRRLILGNTWIEGAWYLETMNPHDVTRKGPVQIGIATFFYDLPNLTLKIDTCNVVTATNDVNTARQLSLTIDDDLLYTHYLVRSVGSLESTGIAVGRFARPYSGPTAIYRGRIFYLAESEQHMMSQAGWKLEDRLVNQFVEKFGEDWRAYVLRDPESQKFLQSSLKRFSSPNEATPQQSGPAGTLAP